MEDICLTPNGKLVRASVCPETPNKKRKRLPDLCPGAHDHITPSKSQRQRGRLTFQPLSPEYEDEDEEERHLQEEQFQLRMRRLRCNGSISPLSEPELDQELELELDLGLQGQGSVPLHKAHTQEINAKVQQGLTLPMHKKATVPQKQVQVKVQQQIQIHGKKHTPHHKVMKPTRSILRIAHGSLNYVVSSSRGSVADATIYATEINATTTTEKMPMVTQPWEKLTIPVNTAIKDKYRRMKAEYFHEETLDAQLLEVPDAAIIRGLAFSPSTNSD